MVVVSEDKLLLKLFIGVCLVVIIIIDLLFIIVFLKFIKIIELSEESYVDVYKSKYF